jgi:hypothetical protein
MVSPRDSQKADLIDTQTQIRGHHLLQIATTILVVLMLTACGKRIGARDRVFANYTDSDQLTEE